MLKKIFRRKPSVKKMIYNNQPSEMLKRFAVSKDEKWQIVIQSSKLNTVGKKKALYHMNGIFRSSLRKLNLTNVKIQQIENELYFVKK